MLLGRDEERLALDRLIAQARDGRSGVLALVGEPGIGKTALLEYAAQRAAGMLLLRARGIESEAAVPFAGLAELLGPALSALARIPTPQATALAGALALGPATPGERFAVGAATLSLLSAFADAGPTAILIDDAHLLDASSADALLFAVRRLVADPIAVVIAAREGEPSLLDGADLRVIRVVGLGRSESAELAHRSGAPRDAAERLYRVTALARAARCRGLLAEPSALEAAFERALVLHARTPDGFEAARTRLAYGARLRRARKRVRAREQLLSALEMFEALGARSWADQASAELTATGETARRRDPSTRDELTPQERQIASLLAEGRTTREAAAALFLSPKTVEYHLGHVYGKLGVNNREALVAALAQAGITYTPARVRTSA